MKSLGLILLFFVTPVVSAQHTNHLSVDEGLPQSFVSGLAEDEDGFIWVSTLNGLARYDGHTFRAVQHRPGDPKTLASNFITSIKKGQSNILLVRYDGGAIDAFDIRSEKASRLIARELISQKALKIPLEGWLVASDSTFWYIAPGEDQVVGIHFPDGTVNQFLFPGGRVFSLFEDRDKNLWGLGEQVLGRFNPQAESFEPIPVPHDFVFDEPPGRNNTPALHQWDNGELMWIAGDHFFFYDPVKNTFRKAGAPGPLGHNVKWITSGPDGKAYFVANDSIYSYGDAEGVASMGKLDVEYNKLLVFLMDRAGLVWLGTNADGLYTVDFSIGFQPFSYKTDFAEHLLREVFDIQLHSFFQFNQKGLDPTSPAYYLRSARQGDKLWVALNRTVCLYSPEQGYMVKPFRLPPSDLKKPSLIKGIAVTKGTPHVIDEGGNLFVLDETGQQWQLLLEGGFLRENTGRDFTPNDLYGDPETGKWWITTEEDGLIILEPESGGITHIRRDNNPDLPTDDLLGMAQDALDSGVLWIASSQGLIRFDKATQDIRAFSVEQGLPDNMIYSLLMDDTGYLWLGTNKGLCRFNTTTYESRTFTRRHGLDNIEFNRFHQLRLPDGKIAFGGVSSGVVFDPASVREDTFEPPVAITEIKLDNVDLRQKANTQDSPNHLDKLSLKHDQNTVAFTFTALQFGQPGDIAYRYRLKGYDDDWVWAGHKREAVYTKLPPGNYTFEVNATNTTGKWSRHVKNLSITIAPPWWNTWWSKALLLLVILSLVLLYMRIRIQQEKIKAQMEIEHREALHLREVDKMKSRFFSNITHEFRTPISLILAPVERLRKAGDPAERNRLLSTITKNTENLLHLTDRLLDITKLESGAWKPYMAIGDVTKVISGIIRAFADEAEAKQVTLSLDAPLKAPYVFDQDTVERIVYNLLSNALKFTPSGGAISVAMSGRDNGIHITVKDNGKGISEKALPNIFKRYYREDEHGNHSGMGIGLSLVKELVSLHKGDTAVESRTAPPSGTVFRVYLPFKKAFSGSHKPSKQEHKEYKSSPNPKILVAEDNKDLASFISDTLGDQYHVLLSENGDEALDKAVEHMPDLILSDVMMEGMDGFELCKALRENIHTSHIPVVLLTARTDIDSRLEGLSLGADDYITKPFHVSELTIRIDNKLELQKRQRDFLYSSLTRLPDSGLPEHDLPIENEFLNKTLQLIDDHIDDSSFGVEELAGSLHMSRVSLHRKIKSIAGMPAGELLKAHRLKRSASLLFRERQISEVAYMTGFTSPSYFTKCFRETYGLTPSEYIENQGLKRG